MQRGFCVHALPPPPPRGRRSDRCHPPPPSLARAPPPPAAWDGGLVLVSHDFRLISQVANEIWVVDKGTVAKWNGDIISYKNHLRKSHAALKSREDLA